MLVNQSLANLSDTCYKTAVLVYVLGLVLSLITYIKEANVKSKMLAAVEAEVETQGDSAVATKRGGGEAEAGTDAIDSVLAKKDASAKKFSGMTQSIIWLGVIIQAISVVTRGMSVHRFPWGNLYEYINVVSLVAMIVAALVLYNRTRRVLWPWVLTPILALMFYGGMKLYLAAGDVVPSLKSFWFPIHVSAAAIGGGIGMISGIASVLFLIRSYQPKGKEHGFWGKVALPLPDIKALDSLAYRSAVLTLPIFGLGIMFGAIWAESAWGRFWNWDPKEVMSFVTWVLYAGYLHARATSGWKNNRAAIINILALAAMVFNLFFINLLFPGMHSYAGVS
ncbi:MAG: c-type cytochrome biogenesis protein CcsB [Corynebacterium sp.]|nr:c-type cytochrome biogenesis protein CcsB [Corynebacterium sp.]